MTAPPVSNAYRMTLGDRWAIFGTWAVLLVVSWWSGGLAMVAAGLRQFFTADIAGLQQSAHPGSLFLPTVIGAIAVGLPLAAAFGWIATALYGKAQSNWLQRRTAHLPRLHGSSALMFKAIVWRDLVDELFARGFVLGLLLAPLSKILGLPMAFYLLFAISATPVLVESLRRYGSEKEQQQLLRVLPQYLMVIVLSVVLVQYGLIASILVHLGYNLVLASVDRYSARRRAGTGRVIIGSLLLIAVSFIGLDKPLNDIAHLQLHGFADYVWGMLFFSGVLMLMLELLMYDPETLEAKSSIRRTPTNLSAETIFKGTVTYDVAVTEVRPTTAQLFWGELANSVMAPAVICILVAVIGLVTAPLHLAFGTWLAVTALFTVPFYIFGGGAVSINGTARLFWENTPILLLGLSAFPVLGFWPTAVALVLREIPCRLIRRSIRYAGM